MNPRDVAPTLIREHIEELSKPDEKAEYWRDAILGRQSWESTFRKRWKKQQGNKFEEQIHRMRDYVIDYIPMDIPMANRIALKLIDHFREEAGEPTVMKSLESKTPPGTGAPSWDAIFQSALKLLNEYDAVAENSYLCIVHDRLMHEGFEAQVLPVLEIGQDRIMEEASCVIAKESTFKFHSLSRTKRAIIVLRAIEYIGCDNVSTKAFFHRLRHSAPTQPEQSMTLEKLIELTTPLVSRPNISASDETNVRSIIMSYAVRVKDCYNAIKSHPFEEQIQRMYERITDLYFTNRANTKTDAWKCWAAQIIDILRKEEGLASMAEVQKSIEGYSHILPPLSASISPPEQAQPHANMSKFAATPIATPTLVYGTPIEDLTEEELIAALHRTQQEIERLKKVPGQSRKIAAKVQELEDAITAITAAIDAE